MSVERSSQFQAEDAETLQSKVFHNSALIRQFRNTSHPVKTSRTVLKLPHQNIANNLTASTLAGPGVLSTEPHVLFCDDIGALIAVYHLGSKLAGHVRIVHGGILMTLLDDCMGRACFPLLPNKVGVTAQLSVSFKKPVSVDTIVVIKAWTDEVEGRKAFVKALVMDGDDESSPYAEASGLFVEPKDITKLDVLI